MKKIVALCALGLASMLFAEAPAVFKKCVACHGADGKKVGVAPKAIAGLPKEEVIKFLNGYKNKTIKTPKAAIMYAQAKNLSDADIAALADYLSALK
ncbi:cytochrome C [Helicobacter enhydrae]|uniref:Cytochrome C n=1 Tax=Helicobacter enhydrae TaxID=222136 RepID=A0A1B1U792_9HELI|nr:c-type cytochrome [Helicobacter enhydrae]ANV98606.1 cytochrome C [Helicobacter enhydrae]